MMWRGVGLDVDWVGWIGVGSDVDWTGSDVGLDWDQSRMRCVCIVCDSELMVGDERETCLGLGDLRAVL